MLLKYKRNYINIWLKNVKHVQNEVTLSQSIKVNNNILNHNYEKSVFTFGSSPYYKEELSNIALEMDTIVFDIENNISLCKHTLGT